MPRWEFTTARRAPKYKDFKVIFHGPKGGSHWAHFKFNLVNSKPSYDEATIVAGRMKEKGYLARIVRWDQLLPSGKTSRGWLVYGLHVDKIKAHPKFKTGYTTGYGSKFWGV